jgi:hypothetical protein
MHLNMSRSRDRVERAVVRNQAPSLTPDGRVHLSCAFVVLGESAVRTVWRSRRATCRRASIIGEPMTQDPNNRSTYVYRWLFMAVAIAAIIYLFHLA